MNDILTARLDMIAENLSEIQNFASLDDRRLTDLQKLKELLNEHINGIACNLANDIVNVSDQIKHLKNKYVFDNLELAQKLDNILTILKQAKESSNDLKEKNDSAIFTTISLINSRMLVEKTELKRIALTSFTGKCTEYSTAIKGVRSKIAIAQNSQNPAERDENWKAAWGDYWNKVHTPTLILFGDYVDFMRGLVTRDCKLDDEICQLADDLINKWKVPGVSLTIPVKYVALEKTVARIVRLSYQDWTTWALPLVACEISYVIHSSETANKEINAYITQEVAAGASETQLRDYLADIFATLGMGPAYAYAAIYLRFDPIHSQQGQNILTPDAWRAETIFKTLDWVSTKKLNGNPYQSICQSLRVEWQDALRQAGQPTQLNKNDDDQIAEWVNVLAEEIYNSDDLGLVYDTPQWDRAVELSQIFLYDKSFSQSSKASDDLRAILNAAWLVRAQKDKEKDIPLEEIKNATKEAMEVILGRKLAPPAQTNKQSSHNPALAMDDPRSGRNG
jgi:hypothetical protein